MTIHAQPIAARIDWLFDLAARHGATFCSPEASLARQRYLALHPTAIATLMCMDGRVNIPVVTRTPIGILMPFRNLGGRFDLGWPYLGEVLARHVERTVRTGRRVLLLITYHFSKGDPQRGCAGFGYDTAAALHHVREIRAQIEHAFGTAHGTVYPLVCGLETDEDTLILHGRDDQTLDLSALDAQGRAHLADALAALLPDMPRQMQDDLLPLLMGNLDRIDAVREQIARRERQLDFEHREWMICLGRGFDFLHTPNVALIIGPYSPRLDEPIRTAAAILRGNMEAGRIPDDGFLLLTTMPYDEIGVDRAGAELKSRFLCAFASEVIHREFPELAGKMSTRSAVLDWRSRHLERIDP